MIIPRIRLMDNNYRLKREDIKRLVNEEDVSIMLTDPLRGDFSEASFKKICGARSSKVDAFFDEFDKIENTCKYEHFLSVTSEISDWIADILCSSDGGLNAESRLKVICNLINVHDEFYIENLTFNESIIQECLAENLISKSNCKILIELLKKDGIMITKWKFLDIVHIRSINCYAKFLYFSWKYNSIFIELFCDQLYDMIGANPSDANLKSTIQVYSDSIISDNTSEIHSVNLTEASQESRITDSMPYRRTETLFHTNSNNRERYADDEDENVYSSDDSNDSDDSTDINYNKLFGEHKSLKDALNFSPPNKFKAPELIKIREYQNELAENGIRGHNVLICAPTGSGKTVVAIKIVEEHFKEKDNSKVIFLVPTNALVEQQYLQFKKYFKNRKIHRQSGQSKSGNLPLDVQISNYDIFIVTSDIFKNSLENDDSKSIIEHFTLVIFDECHHCDKGHSYNKVMDYYFSNKCSGVSVPQIIGMTASTGTDKAKSITTAVNNLFTLCANLDCEIVSTVKINVQELQENQSIPTDDILTPCSRNFDEFENNLLDLMNVVEQRVLTLLENNKKSICIPPDKFHDKYINFVSKLSKDYLTCEDSKEIRNLAEHLEVYYRALLVNNLFTSLSAFKMIKSLKNDAPASFEFFSQKELKNFISNSNWKQDENPSLVLLKTEITNQLKKDKTSRIIIFVKEVKYATILEGELNSAGINGMKCSSFVGTNKSALEGGSTSSFHTDVLSKFRKGIINVICCTSVAEEGLDVEHCNLVIRYGYVTNETSMIQTRGRARAKDSRYIVIVPHKLEWLVKKERINKFRETMMYQAIEKFQNMTKEEITRKINELQRQRKLYQKYDSSSLQEPKADIQDSKVWSVHCKKCEKYLCDSSDIRVKNGNSYIVINKDKFENIPVGSVEPNSAPVNCTDGHHIGFVHKHDGISFPSLKQKCILLKSGSDKQSIPKWSNAPFNIPEATLCEMTDASDGAYGLQ